jgi:hypothetical protein
MSNGDRKPNRNSAVDRRPEDRHALRMVREKIAAMERQARPAAEVLQRHELPGIRLAPGSSPEENRHGRLDMKTLRNAIRDSWPAMREKFWRLFLRALRAVTLAVDDWIQRQEVALREKTAVAQFQAEVDPVQSRKREKVSRAAKPRRPRLVYQHGEFVEVR